MRPRVGLLLAVALTVFMCVLPSTRAVAQPPLSVAISGNHFVDQNGATVVLRGANTSGTEYACVSERSIFDGAQEASSTSISWPCASGASTPPGSSSTSPAARCPEGEPRLLGTCLPAGDQAVRERLERGGMYVIVDMHFSSKGGKAKATRQVPMPDARYAPAFWFVCGRRLQEQPGGHLRPVQRALSEPQHRFPLFLGL